jgi:hypothetical protein
MTDPIHTVRALIKVCKNRRLPELALDLIDLSRSKGYVDDQQVSELKKELSEVASAKPQPKRKKTGKNTQSIKRANWKYPLFFFSKLKYPAVCARCSQPIELGRPAAVDQNKNYLHIACTEHGERENNPYYEKLKSLTRGVIEPPEDESS